MRFRQRFCVLPSLQEALTCFRGHRHLHCKTPEEYNTSLQGTGISHLIDQHALLVMSTALLKSLLVPPGFRRGAIKPRVVPFQVSLQTVRRASPAACTSSPCKAAQLHDIFLLNRHKSSLSSGMLRNGCPRGVCCRKQALRCCRCCCPSGCLKQPSKWSMLLRYQLMCTTAPICVHESQMLYLPPSKAS